MPTTANSKDHEEEEEGEEEEEEGIEHIISRRHRGTTCNDGVASVSDCGNSSSRGSGSRGSVVIRRPPPRWMVLLVGAASTTTIASGGAGVVAGRVTTTAFVPSGSSYVGRRVFGTLRNRCIFQRRNLAFGNRPLGHHCDLDIRSGSNSRSFSTGTTHVSNTSCRRLVLARPSSERSARLFGNLSSVAAQDGDCLAEESSDMTSSPTMDPTATVDTSATSPPGENDKRWDEASTTTMTKRARRVPSTPDSISACAERLREGELVSFPTETVYGLGCNALSGDAALKIFAAKERPYTDPLISHVAKADDAFALWSTLDDNDGSDEAVRVLRALTDRFWPGPLTLVFDASPSVPPILTANTGRAAVRCPSHPLARALIAEAGVPIAAPSANKFGHVSPTRADHVLDDLGEEDVWVIDPDMMTTTSAVGGALKLNGDAGGSSAGEGSPRNESPCCRVGVESTVALVDGDTRTVSVLRHGAVSPGDVRDCLTAAGVEGYRVVDVKKMQEEELVAAEKGRGRPSRSSDEDGQHGGGAPDVAEKTLTVVGDVSPGQTVRHYSPHVPSFLISSDRYNNNNNNNHRNGEMIGTSSTILRPGEEETLRRAVVIDFGGRLSFVRDRCLAYRDLSPGGCSSEAASTVFESLRWAECVDGAERVYFPEIVSSSPSSSSAVGVEEEEDALTLALRDRLTRAASAVVTDEFR